ncbi:MAG TPA: retroviral-like aspartic protease family protein [Caulobacteraceae bacterium]|jgi:clan AA aspartic protease (TIGR02281 family)|nr:retroviral-like aspartic protease family protein [Caulobacteraceae bacterium]
MTTPGENEPLTIHKVGSRKRRGGGFNYSWFIAAVLVMGVGAAGAYMVLGKKGGPLEVKPQGVASLSAAEACYRDSDFACTEADYEAYLQKYPNDQTTNARLALVLTRDGRHKEALPYYRKAEGLGAATYDFDAGYAESLEATGDLDGAIEKNRASLKIVPSLVDVRGSLANELVRKGKPQEAIDLLESFDRTLEDEGEQPYFTSQIEQIKANMNSGASATAKTVAAESTAAPLQGVTQNGVSEIKLERADGALYVPVMVDNALTLKFVVDSGATDVTISSDVAQTLTRMGKLTRGDYLGHAEFVLADGSHAPSQLFIIRSLKVGDRELHDVTALITNSHGSLLLGQSFLRRFKSWSIDNRRGMLILTD